MQKKNLLFFHDLNAKAMWKKRKKIIYKDRSKYTRKIKYKKIDF